MTPREYAREYYRRNREKIRARQREYEKAKGPRVRTPQQKARHAETATRWQQANRDRHRAANKAYRERNPEKTRLKSLRWHRANPDKVAAKSKRYAQSHRELKRDVDARRRSRMAQGVGVTTAEWREVKRAAVGLCAYCGHPRRLTLDHLDPIARGGRHEPDNITAACKSCNSAKNDSTLVVWLARRAA